MRALRKMAVMVMLMMASMTKTVWEGGKWVARSFFPNLAPPVDDVEESLDHVANAPKAGGTDLPGLDVDFGQRCVDYALARLSGGRHPAPSMQGVPDDIVKWVGALPPADLHRLTQHGAKRVGEHALGERPIANLALCREPRLQRGFARVGNEIVPVGKCADEPAKPKAEDPKATALAILQDLIDDQPEPAALRAA
ncbi:MULTISPECIES: hypothetical protein [unclassified Methylobacterium]|uniref:hypothetical protein n=1 Tax=unclassified Methylobacterium TaxID=2615210 RepID=UPI0036F5288A